MVPASKKGRGVILVDGEGFEFQSADPTKCDDLVGYLSQVSKQLLEGEKEKAPEIKSLPKVVDYDYVKDEYDVLTNLPIGVNVNKIEIYKYNFLGKKVNIISGGDSEIMLPYVRSLIELISMKKDTLKAIVFDGENYMSNLKSNVTYVNKEYSKRIDAFSGWVDNISEKTKQTLVFFVGLSKINEEDEEFSFKFATLIEKMSKSNKVNAVIIDEIDEIRTHSSQMWYSSYVSTDSLIFVGNGLDSQYIFQIKGDGQEIREKIPDNFGFVLSKGKPIKIQLLEVISQEDNNEK